jgi:hypothetical protein
MTADSNKLWKKARSVAATDEAESVRTLAKILTSKDGREFISNLEPSDAKLCIEILDQVILNPRQPSLWSLTNTMVQGLAEHKFHAAEKQAFFSTLRRLAGKHARLPSSMVITEEIDFSAPNQLHTSGGFADIKPGRYKECTVAVKTMRVAMSDNFDRIRKVGRKLIFVVGWDDAENSLPAIL